ncbi:hypothetical protein B0J13DRAFT_198386 [Dactylonectria estremocensis]|uniref:Uncharacterized protein n=1 Tax=Dactylonectria estremocensis TaxID=1079267 RepID=A0A9P9DFH6_9HYPO|nr:hypothetical protein B0J13DRAFT_198386 [Dactylonectria estremocensis]
MDQSPTPTPTPLTTNALTRLLQVHQQSVAKQAASASVTALPSNPQLEDLPVITWRNKRFFLESHVARKGSRGRSSWIKDYGVFLIELDSNNQRLDTVWCCQLCDKQGAPRFFKIKATTTAQEQVVPPNDPMTLARAQIAILGMVGPWTRFTDEAEMKTNAPTLPDEITPDDVKWLYDRFYAKSEYRRKLGMMSRQVVLHSFRGSRYLREHEQMFWIQWHQSKMRSDDYLRVQATQRFKFGTPAPLRYAEDDENAIQ